MSTIVLAYVEHEELAEVESKAWRYQRVANVLAGYAKVLSDGGAPNWHTVQTLVNASRSRIESALTEHSAEALLFFGHGVSGPAGGFRGREESPLLIDPENLHLLQGGILFAAACWSAAAIGQRAVDLGAAVLGYRQELMVPLREPFVSQMGPIVLSGALMLLEGKTLSEAFSATLQGYRELAQALFAKNSPPAKSMAVFIKRNVASLTLLGDGQRVLRKNAGASL